MYTWDLTWSCCKIGGLGKTLGSFGFGLLIVEVTVEVVAGAVEDADAGVTEGASELPWSCPLPLLRPTALLFV